MFGLFRAWRRRRLTKRPFPEEWHVHLTQHVPFYRRLDPRVGPRFLDLLKVFVWEKHFIGAKGLEVTDEHRVVISAVAARLILHLDLSHYNRLTEIIIYPYDYQHPDGTAVLGEAHRWGTVVLSWPAVLAGLANQRDAHATATHELAHVLDVSDGRFDGTPLLRSAADYSAWRDVMSHYFSRLRSRGKRIRKVLRRYGATNEAEFFAVSTESFFEKPARMFTQTPELYEELKRFYGCDPARQPGLVGAAELDEESE